MILCVKGDAGLRRGLARPQGAGRDTPGANAAPDRDFLYPFGLMSPGQTFALMARRHMEAFGTTTRQFGEVAVATRFHASRNPAALYREPITLEDHENSRMIADPLRLLDFCLETDGGTAVIVTSAERARDLRQKPVYVMAAAQGGHGRWGQGIFWQQMPEEYYGLASGHRPLAKRLFAMAGIGPEDIDVAEMYDHFSPLGDHAAGGLRLLPRSAKAVRMWRTAGSDGGRPRCRWTATAETCRRCTCWV